MRRLALLLSMILLAEGAFCEELELPAGTASRPGIEIPKVTVNSKESLLMSDADYLKEIIGLQREKDLEDIENCEPVYETFEGNFGDLSNIKKREDLPENAQKYLNKIEEIVKTPIRFIGTGAGRDAMIVC